MSVPPFARRVVSGDRMTLTLPAAPATSLNLDFHAACQAILAGRPGALFYRGAEPRFAAVEPWIVATLYADRLCWRSYDRNRDTGEFHAAAIDGHAALQLLETLWTELDGDETVVDAPARPQLPVWFSYELGEWLEPAARRNRAGVPAATATAAVHADRVQPLGGFLLPRVLLAADTGLDAASPARGRRLLRRFERWIAEQHAATAPAPAENLCADSRDGGDLIADERDRYLAAVDRVQQYIAAGDVYQVNVTRREQLRIDRPAGAWYAHTLTGHPAAQASYWSCVDAEASGVVRRHFLSFTPERLLRIEHRPGSRWELLSSPIKGTRPRPAQATAAELNRIAAELMQDDKEQAELNMIVDMTRNDLGRIADLGSVRVLTSGRIDRLPFVFHRVADVAATVAQPIPLVTLLRALFPGASITGAPKIRAMQIIRELEPTPRGIYCGVLGWLSSRRRLDWALAIRTLEVATLSADPAGPWQGRFGVGAGIVADSAPEREWQESVAKTRGILP